MDIRLEHISKSFENQQVLKDINLYFSSGKTYCLMGASGRGKTTLLNIIMGLIPADSGKVYINHKELKYSKKVTTYGLGKICLTDGTPVKMSAVFQEDRLCEKLNAVQNVSIVPLKKGLDVTEQLGCLLPADSLTKPVSELSGGMRRRVAIVRAMAADSEAVILDEPFTGLDADTKQKTMEYILNYKENRTLIVVTHNVEDAAALKAEVVDCE